MDKESIDKEVGLLGIEAHMFWELPQVREMFNELCKKWFYSDNKAYTHPVINISECQYNQYITLECNCRFPKGKKQRVE